MSVRPVGVIAVNKRIRKKWARYGQRLSWLKRARAVCREAKLGPWDIRDFRVLQFWYGDVLPYREWDWWVYYTNKTCVHHAGKGLLQDLPSWVKPHK
jgi:hypothetical protein